jgi:hypothetical protein
MDEYYKIIAEGDDYQIRLTVSDFRDNEYLHIRKYYLDFNEEWLPTKEGFSIPLSLDTAKNLFDGLVEILSNAESKTILQDHFWDTIQELYK